MESKSERCEEKKKADEVNGGAHSKRLSQIQISLLSKT